MYVINKICIFYFYTIYSINNIYYIFKFWLPQVVKTSSVWDDS